MQTRGNGLLRPPLHRQNRVPLASSVCKPKVFQLVHGDHHVADIVDVAYASRASYRLFLLSLVVLRLHELAHDVVADTLDVHEVEGAAAVLD